MDSRSAAEQLHRTKIDRVSQSLKMVTEVFFDVCYVKFDDFEKLGGLIPHEEARSRGILQFLPTYVDVLKFTKKQETIFISHQWLGYQGPDPAHVHYSAAVQAVRNFLELQGMEEEDVYVWIDYLCIPQKNKHLQKQSISALGLYASCSSQFIILAPETKHCDSGNVANVVTYESRGWCRLEQWACITAGKLPHMYIWDGSGLEELGGKPDLLLDSVQVFEGDFTDPSDKDMLVDTVMGLWSIMYYDSQKLMMGSPLPAAVDSSDETTLHSLVMQNKARVFPKDYFGDLIDVLEELIDGAEDNSLSEMLKRRDSQLSTRKPSHVLNSSSVIPCSPADSSALPSSSVVVVKAKKKSKVSALFDPAP